MSILKNAIDSIVIGLEDYQSTDERRIISSARNIFAGILLLFKHKLLEMSPTDSNEVLIKQRVLPEIGADGVLRWIGKGSKTVNVQNIRERFEALGIAVDWNRIERIRKIRNDIEHYYSNLNNQSVQQIISESFLIIRDFISEHLNDDPQQLLGDSAWSVLIEIHEVYEKEKTECLESLISLEFFNEELFHALANYSCEKCGSGLIQPVDGGIRAELNMYKCKACGITLEYENIINHAVYDHFSYQVYLSHTEGGENPITDCPECAGIYLYREGICSSCGYSAEHECQPCGSNILPEELASEPFCGFCAHMMSKDE